VFVSFLPAVFNLVEQIDVAATEAKISAYQKANQEQIARNQARAVQHPSRYPSDLRFAYLLRIS
jgi:hypothetical protein